MDKEQTKGLMRSARGFFLGTSMSRVSGMVRDITLAFCFGSGVEIAGFLLAYRLANLFRRLLGEGTLQEGFIPYFEELRSSDPGKGALFFRDLLFSTTFSLLLLVGIGEGILFFFRSYETIRLIQILLPGLIFIALYALDSAVLQCQKRYFLPAAAPIFFNLAWIGAALFAYKKNSPMEILSVGVVCAFFLQWLITFFYSASSMTPFLRGKKWLEFTLFSSELKKIYRPLLFVFIGVAAVQVNTALDAVFSRLSDPSGPAYLWYAARLYQLPLALFGIAIAKALLPPLSRASVAKDKEEYKRLLHFSMRQNFILMSFCLFGIFALGGPSINLLFGRGDFTAEAVKETLFSLWGYGVGLIASTAVLLLASSFYARKEYKTPMRGALLSVGVNIFLNTIFVFYFQWGAASIAYATSISALINRWFIFSKIKKELGNDLVPLDIPWKVKITSCGLISASGTWMVGYLFYQDPGVLGALLGKEFSFPTEGFKQLTHFTTMALTFFFFYFSLAKVGRISEVFLFFGKTKKALNG